MKKIVVLGGGNSAERAVSLRSSANVAASLRTEGYRVVTADPGADTFDLAKLSKGATAVLPILHGAGGEDGSIQTELEAAGLPYVGSRPEACALTFDKVRFKECMAEHGVLTPNWEVVDRQSFETSGLRRSSYVLKPIRGGSSIDTLVVHNPLHQRLTPEVFGDLFGRYGEMLLEELIEGDEVTVGVLEEKALPVILIIPPAGEEFDYENKYNGRTQELVQPAQLPVTLQESLQALALAVHELCGCRHLSRTDMIVAPDGAVYVLENNTMPGLTAQSLLPKAAAAVGIHMDQLAVRLVKMAVRDA